MLGRLLRHLTAGGYDDPERRLDRAMKCLNTCRKGDSQWRVFPFWYTLSALIEMDTKAATAEMRYAAPKCEKPANWRAAVEKPLHSPPIRNRSAATCEGVDRWAALKTQGCGGTLQSLALLRWS